jgi:hypothetical protein
MIVLSVLHHHCFCRGDACIHGNNRCRFTSWEQEEPTPRGYGKYMIYQSSTGTSLSGIQVLRTSSYFVPIINLGEVENDYLVTNKVSIRFNEKAGSRRKTVQ